MCLKAKCLRSDDGFGSAARREALCQYCDAGVGCDSDVGPDRSPHIALVYVVDPTMNRVALLDVSGRCRSGVDKNGEAAKLKNESRSQSRSGLRFG